MNVIQNHTFAAHVRNSAALLFLLLCLSLNAQTVPWVLPWNDSLPGATDFSSLNPAISHERIKADADGHFTIAGKRIRFLGVNLASDSPFMPTNYADAVAGRLAKFGINAVRLHHMDPSWAYGGGIISYTSSTSTNLNPSQLNRLHYLVSRLKAHGIYSDVNLLVGREYRSGDGLGADVAGMDWKDAHILGFFYAPALALQKDYAMKLLTPTNRFTGLPLARDPAVAFVEIINENGILQKWYDGGLDRLPVRYSTALRERWNAWLLSRYKSTASMLAAWNVIDQPLGTNLISNGDFAQGLEGWNAEQHGSAQAAFSRTFEFLNDGPSARVTVTSPDSVAWHIQLNHPGLKLISNQVYTISYWAKSSPPTNVDASLMQAHNAYSGLGYAQRLALTGNWQHFSNSFQATANDANARVNFGSMGDKSGTFWFADVRLEPGGQIGVLPNGTSLEHGLVPNIHHSGDGFVGTREARRDWLRFLRDLEYDYYRAMLAHLRGSIGYNGLVFGTIMSTSPATVQSRLDVIDGHAYWQHPQFPGADWDSHNWFEPNISMVNTLGNDNTLAGLARQRIRGKPFMVTEYQHPSPNYYGGEGPLLLAAYAGLQDWDGLWLFDYGLGCPAGPMEFVNGYFNIDQHPTKMANLLLAASLFRRGDVRPATQTITMALTPERELDLLQHASSWNMFSSGQMGMPPSLAFVHRLSTAIGERPSGLITPPGAPAGDVLTSDTGELKWDLSRGGAGAVTINTARTKAVLGYTDNRTFSFDGISLRPGTTRLGWSTLGITLTRGEDFTHDCTALVVATGWWENTGQHWTDTSKVSVGRAWGKAPVLTEVVPFTLTLPVAANRVSAWALDERGQHKTALPVSGDGSSARLTVNNSGSIWYEIKVSR